MNIKIDSNGLKIKKLFSSKEVPFSDIEKIEMHGSKMSFRFKDGSTLNYMFSISDYKWLSSVIDAIKKYNIEYEDANETGADQEFYYTEDLDSMILKVQEIVMSVAAPLISAKMGPEFGLNYEIRAVGGDISLYLFLTKNGIIVDVPEALKNEDDNAVPNSFDNIFLAYLVRWDSSLRKGQYGVTTEMTDGEQCRKTTETFLNQSFELWKDHTF